MSPPAGARFVFVPCDGPTGRRRPQHVMHSCISVRSRVKGTTNALQGGGSGSESSTAVGSIAEPEGCMPATANSSLALRNGDNTLHAKSDQEGCATRRRPANRRAIIKRRSCLPNRAALRSIEACASPLRHLGVPLEGEQRVAQWWFYCNESLSPPWEAAHYHWAKAGWEIGRDSSWSFQCLELCAWRKAAHFTGKWDVYLSQQSQLIRRIRRELDACDSTGLDLESLALIAIGVLASSSFADGNLENSAMHLHALRTFDTAALFEHLQHEWCHVVWVDLRLSLLRGKPPVLKYFIPLAFREAFTVSGQSDTCVLCDLACRNSAMAPSSSLFKSTESQGMFFKLHRLHSHWRRLRPTKAPPYGLIFDLEYHLRVVHARFLQPDQRAHLLPDENPVTVESCVELVVIAIQLHVWLISRYWAPLSPCNLQRILKRASDLLAHPPPLLVAKWKCTGDLRTLVWCLITVITFFLEITPRDISTLLSTLRYVLDTSKISVYDELSNLIQEWFWLDDWHPGKLPLVWKMIDGFDIEKLPSSLALLPKPKSCVYIGGDEFFSD